MKADKRHILICGNYGATNWGDEAILAGLINLIKSTQKSANITVMSATPTETTKAHRVNAIWHFPAGFNSFFKYWFTPTGWQSLFAVTNCDLVLLGGGGLFNDERPRAVWIWFVQFWWFTLLGKRVFCIAQSVGPVRGRLAKMMTKFVFKRAVAITVRDNQSKRLLREWGVYDVKVLADPAFAVGYDGEKALNREKRVTLTARNWLGNTEDSNRLLAEVIDWLYEKKGLKVAFIPFQTAYENDLDRFKQIAHLVENKAALELLEAEDYPQAMEMIGRSELVIGMRLHSIIFAVLTQTPFLAISYSKKVKDFVETIALSEYCLDYKKLELQAVQRLIENALEERKSIEQKLEKAKLLGTYKFFEHEAMIKDLLESF